MVILAFYKLEYGQLQETATAFGVRALGILLANSRFCYLSPLDLMGPLPVSPLNGSLPAVSRAPALQRLRRSSLCARFTQIQPTMITAAPKRIFRVFCFIITSGQICAGYLTGLWSITSFNATGAPPRALLKSAASINAIISKVSSGGTGGAPVWKNFTTSTSRLR
jgi:hypothetical protein